jgi:hypothetical protein
MPTFKVSRSRKRSASSRRKYVSKSPWSSRTKKSKYSPKKKQQFINRSNPVAENKIVASSEISKDVGRNALGNNILTDYSENPSYLGNEVPFGGAGGLIVANLPTGARGFPVGS